MARLVSQGDRHAARASESLQAALALKQPAPRKATGRYVKLQGRKEQGACPPREPAPEPRF